MAQGACRPGASSSVREQRPATSPGIVELADLRPVIDATGHSGTVLVFDAASDRYHGVYSEGSATGRIPASTFKVFSTLLALELGLAAEAGTTLAWDGVPRERTELNRDLTLRDAFQLSAVPHFQELVRRAGAENTQAWLTRAEYGNTDMDGGLEEFWLSGDLRISPLEQIRFLDALRTGSLPFSSRAQAVTRQVMVLEEGPGYVLRAKTGWARGEWGSTGWWVGWVERGAEAHVFATVLESVDPQADLGPHRQNVTRAVLRHLDVLP